MPLLISKYYRLFLRFWPLLTLLLLGTAFFAAGMAYLMIMVYRSLQLSGQFQELVYYGTLQFLPHFWRFATLVGVGILLLTFTLFQLSRSLLNPFRGHYADLADVLTVYHKRTEGPRIVCIGGGIGTAQLIRGLKQYAGRLSVVVHMTDDGGSAGRLRRSLGLPPLGDIVSNLVALSDAEALLKKLLLYRFQGERYGKDTDLGGHKLGNLLFAAMANITGDLNRAIEQLSRVFAVRGDVLPVTLDNVFLHARTRDGIEVEGEENIDLGNYEGEKVLESIWYEPKTAQVNPKVIAAVEKADIIVLGPGDLYTSILANLIFQDLTQAINRSQAFKCYVLNVANKPYETRGYTLDEFIKAFARHGAEHTFETIFVNANQSLPIPTTPEYEGYSYVSYDRASTEQAGYRVVEGDYLEPHMGGVEGKGASLYHDPDKIAASIVREFERRKVSR